MTFVFTMVGYWFVVSAVSAGLAVLLFHKKSPSFNDDQRCPCCGLTPREFRETPLLDPGERDE